LTGSLFSIRNVSKVFPNGNRALSNVSLDIFEGECLLIAGSNGSGKTLLMRITCGLLDASAGEVLFRGVPLNKAVAERPAIRQQPADANLRPANLRPASLRQSVGMVFQDADSQIVGETVAEDVAFGPKNLRLPKQDVQERVDWALAAMGLAEKRDFPPRRLSGGEQRRLAVAGLLAMGCEAIIMDEPFATLAWPGVVQVLEVIRQMKAEGKTLVILTHELEKTLAFADRLVILDKGVIRDAGRSEEVLDRLDPAYGVRDPRRSYGTVADCTWL
jgi:biotin transport system ATP-binding protein